MENNNPNLKLLQIIAQEEKFAPIDGSKHLQRKLIDSTGAQ